MKSISVLNNTHKCIMDQKDSEHKSADAVVMELINSNNNLKQTVERLMEDIHSERLLVGEFDENEQNLIVQVLDGPLQSEDIEMKGTAESIEMKLKQYGGN